MNSKFDVNTNIGYNILMWFISKVTLININFIQSINFQMRVSQGLFSFQFFQRIYF